MKALEMATRISKTAGLAMMMVALMTPATAQTRRIVVSIPDHKLALVEDGEVKKVYPVATGRQKTPSPTGRFQIANRVTNPTYYHQGKKVEPGPQNPVGTRWIGLDEKGYGIHGTNAPGSIGKSASHGCIRMAKKDLEEFFEMVRPGDVVEIRGERDEETAEMFGTEMLETKAPATVTQIKPVVMASNEAAPSGGQ
jgi:lipoprotein-anchoring transpeptidase ErfK/SrfK